MFFEGKKRGTVRDVAIAGAVFFAMGLFLFIVHFMNDTMRDEMLANPNVNISSEVEDAFNSVDQVNMRLDWIFLGFFIAYIIATLITAWLVGGHPIFMVAYIIVIIVSVAISPFLSNAWEDITQSAVFGVTINSFPITNHILTTLPYYVVVLGLIGFVVMFGKPGGEK